MAVGSVEACTNHWSAWSETKGRVGLLAKLIRQIACGGTAMSPLSRMMAVIRPGAAGSQPYATERMSTGVSSSGTWGRTAAETRASCRSSRTCGSAGLGAGTRSVPEIVVCAPVVRLSPPTWCVTKVSPL